MRGLEWLGEVSRTYQAKADEYRGVAVAAAEAEAEHKSQRAQAILRHKASVERMSMAEAETRAEADEEIAVLYRKRLIAAALADAHREKLRQLKEQIAYGRTYAATEREIDRMHGDNYGGAA